MNRSLQVAALSKELLYIDYYFRKQFQKKFDRENADMPDANMRISFAHNARTICIAFVAFACRYYKGNLSRQELQIIFNASRSENASEMLYDIFRNLEGVNCLLPANIFAQKTVYEGVLDKLFTAIINAGITTFALASMYDTSITATNYLKKDKNYYSILQANWIRLETEIKEILGSVMN